MPSMLALACFTIDVFGIRDLSGESVAVAAVCLAPQMTHMMASDTPRIWTYSILSAFLVLWVYTEVRTRLRDASAAVRILCLGALALNIVSLTPLMDYESDHLALAARLLLYAPVVVTALALMLSEDPVPIKETCPR